ncbi:globin domain-containing protein [Pelagibaculum spongiae]|uniref:Globin domain-containing protein n=1 Tax=Pelagibaculum spongiae TaxID=2080658 RepID=A0A2V1GUY0_9GAMM|nr:globin domain-containing protein [Pelagibaculum spongiae]PVZ69491.1 hypothetical protein DC094_09170 [Pelagibaculum spongiae]
MSIQRNQLIQHNWQGLDGVNQGFAEAYYKKLFELDPTLQSLFPAKMQGQIDKLNQTMTTLVDAIDQLESMKPSLRALGQKHYFIYFAEKAHYPLFGEALIETLKQFSGDSWTDETEQAWRHLYQELVEAMLKGALSF